MVFINDRKVFKHIWVGRYLLNILNVGYIDWVWEKNNFWGFLIIPFLNIVLMNLWISFLLGFLRVSKSFLQELGLVHLFCIIFPHKNILTQYSVNWASFSIRSQLLLKMSNNVFLNFYFICIMTVWTLKFTFDHLLL